MLDLAAVPLTDETGAQALLGFVKKARKAGAQVYFAGASRSVTRRLLRAGLGRGLATYVRSVEEARKRLRDKQSAHTS